MVEVPTLILGSAGYVGGEVLRLLSGHPVLRLRGAVSRSKAGQPVAQTFPHLGGVWPTETFVTLEAAMSVLEAGGPCAAFSCLPHGQAAGVLGELLAAAAESGAELKVVDLSADFRLPDPAAWSAVYGGDHGAPDLFSAFTCGLPELSPDAPTGHVAHPGCFTTAVTLACAPLMGRGLTDQPLRVSAVTGSTGSGARPSENTHHPWRNGNLKAYGALHHRHAPEMEMLLGRLADRSPEVRFVPHSGPFARGIHATVHVDLSRAMTTEDLTEEFRRFYEAAPFVDVSASPPTLKDVVGTNRCRIGVVSAGSSAVVMSVIDNMVKGAAGGAVQWMNRLLGLEETAGLTIPGIGWS